jgi:hypothetical protein
MGPLLPYGSWGELSWDLLAFEGTQCRVVTRMLLATVHWGSAYMLWASRKAMCRNCE